MCAHHGLAFHRIREVSAMLSFRIHAAEPSEFADLAQPS